MTNEYDGFHFCNIELILPGKCSIYIRLYLK